MYFQPKVIYRNPQEARKDSIIRYIGNRVLRNNKNFLCALTGQTGVGKSWAALKMCELYSEMFDIPFDPNIHVISSLKELLLLITGKEVDKNIRFGSIIMFDEPQTEANARDWQSNTNRALSQLMSTFRNQRLVVLFCTPYLDFIDKQSRVLFHGDFKVLGYDKNTKITKIKPRFLEYNKRNGDFYRKRLIIKYSVEGNSALESSKLNFWHVSVASSHTLEVYEAKKKIFTDELNTRLLKSMELKEKEVIGKNKNDDFMKVLSLYDQYGRDFVKISQEMPHMSPLTIERYVQLGKKSVKGSAIESPST